MTSITHYPHSLNTKHYAVLLYKNRNPISFVCRRYKCSKVSVMRWNKKFDGTKNLLIYKSHKPLSKHPNAHTDEELSSYSTIDFVKRAIVYFGYKPEIIQTDNSQEFTYTIKTDKTHPLDNILNKLGITHKLIKPRTPRHKYKEVIEMINKDSIHILNSILMMIY